MTYYRLALSFIFLLFLHWISASQIHEFTHPDLLSFEDGVHPAKTKGESVLTISSHHYKHGKSSLHWQWTQMNSSWEINQPIPYTQQNPFNDNSVSTFVFWVYAPQLLNGKLLFEFYKDDKLCSWFEYGLDFQGWSGAWIAFDRDMQGKPEEGMNEMRVTVQGADKGELFFDQMILSSFQDVRHHTADFQAPYVNAETTSHWLVLLDSWNKLFDISLPKASMLGNEIQDFARVEQRLKELLLDKSKPIALSKLTQAYQKYQIKENPDGSIVGLPVYFERFGETFAHMGAVHYQKLYGNEMGLRTFNRLLLNMAKSYHLTQKEEDKQVIATMFISMMRHAFDQGFRAGSAMGTLHHLGYSMRNYYTAVFLMRPVLIEMGLSREAQQSLEWFAGTGEVKTEPDVLGMDVDAFNTTLIPRLASILMIDDAVQKSRYMHAFARWIDNGLQFSTGTQGTFKIDGSIYHHRHNYPAYAIGGLEGATQALWILHNTTYQPSQTGYENLKNAMLAMRFYCNLTHWPLSLSGRHPDGEGQLIPAHYARLAKSGGVYVNDQFDRDLAAVYLRLVGDTINEDVVFFQQNGVQTEKSPEGNRSFPYSNLNIHRRNDWMVSAMGHSRYLWATETYIGANLYGRYLNHGHLQIIATGEPISNFGSGFKQEGWDWNHFAGTTAAELPITELRSDIKNLDEDSGYEEMLLSDEAFAGSISIAGKNGAFAMKLHEHDKYNGSLRARKSFFFFDDRVVALGTNIRSDLPESEVHTTLFQVYQPAEQYPVSFNRQHIKSFPYTTTIYKKQTEISDGLNNYFFVKDGEVALKRTVQHSYHEETDEPTQNPFSLAYINHGKQAVDDTYEYMVLIQPDNKRLKTVRKSISSSKKPVYQVLQKDSVAHIVFDKANQTTAYVFFEAGIYADKTRFVSVDTPCLLMTEELNENQLHLSIADPDLRFYEGAADEQYDENGKRIERSVYSRNWINNPSVSSKLTLTLKGNWQLMQPSEHIHIKSMSDTKTTFEVDCQHGLSREVKLVNRD